MQLNGGVLPGDNDLFDCFKRGDDTALTDIYNSSCKMLLWHARRYIKDEFVVNSIVQDAYLKAWERREEMKSLRHVTNFMRMTIVWLCYRWYRSSKNSFYLHCFKGVDDLDAGQTFRHYQLSEMEENTLHFDRERIEKIEKVVPYLSPTQQNLFDLHFRYGFSYKTIATRYGRSYASVSVELQKGLEYLRKIINAQNLKTSPSMNALSTSVLSFADVRTADDEMKFIVKLRREYKMGFDQIAEKLQLDWGYVLETYKKALNIQEELHASHKKRPYA